MSNDEQEPDWEAAARHSIPYALEAVHEGFEDQLRRVNEKTRNGEPITKRDAIALKSQAEFLVDTIDNTLGEVAGGDRCEWFPNELEDEDQ